MAGRIFVTGDTHGIAGDQRLLTLSDKGLDKDDIVIVAGDFGYLFSEKFKSDSDSILEVLSESHRPLILWVDGNHENFDMISQLETVEMFGSDVGRVNDRVFHLRRGRIYEILGKKILTFGGASSVDRGYRTIGIDWWPGEVPSISDYNRAMDSLDAHGNKIDVIIAHTCPTTIARELVSGSMFRDKLLDPTCVMLESLCNCSNFGRFYFGHWHKDQATFQDKRFIAVYKELVSLSV